MSDETNGGGVWEPVRRRDRVVDEAKELLLERYFAKGTTKVYYGRQIEVGLEGKFFHWITSRALNELVKEGVISFSKETTTRHTAHFYWPRPHRYARRQIAETLNLIAQFSQPTFTRAVGHYGEILADAGFANIGFRVRGRKVREVDGRRWTETNHDLEVSPSPLPPR